MKIYFSLFICVLCETTRCADQWQSGTQHGTFTTLLCQPCCSWTEHIQLRWDWRGQALGRGAGRGVPEGDCGLSQKNLPLTNVKKGMLGQTSLMVCLILQFFLLLNK